MAGRPREFDREAALIQARDLFWRHGFEGTSMSDLVAALGIASARIYKAFGSKEQLFREAVAHYAEHEGGFAARALEEGDIATAIRRMLMDAVALYTRPRAPAGCMVVSSASALSDENQPLQQWMAEQRRLRTESVIDRFRRAAEAGQLRGNADPALLGNYYALLLHGLSVQARDGVPADVLESVVKVSLAAL
nr:helix-turn-helix domain-containing protein [uncultured Erwinia sp.]